jgi:cell division transport system permease protein
MFTQRSDLPLDKDALSQFLPWLIAFMVFLSVLAMTGMLLLASTAARWDQGVTGTLTVQIMPAGTPSKDTERLQKVLLFLGKLTEVKRFETLSDDKMIALLKPWLGTTVVSGDLPLPRLVDVELKSGVELDLKKLSERFDTLITGVTIDDHSVWLERLVRLTRVLEGLAAIVLLFIGLATVGTVVFTTRTGLAIHHNAIEVLHFIGAQDSYIASQFASRALTLGLKGGVIGLFLAIPTLWSISAMARQMDSSLLPDINLGITHYLVGAALPIVISLIAMLTARLTVIKTLSRML